MPIGTQRRETQRGELLKTTWTWKSVSRLKPHPLNDKIYGKPSPDKKLIDSVKDYGVLTPIVVDQKDRILSGHRRWEAAKKVGQTKIPTITFRTDNSGVEGVLEELYLVEANQQRIKTRGQIAREAAERLRIERELAKSKKKGKKSPMVTVGETMGVSKYTVGKSAVLVSEAEAGNKQAKQALKALDKNELTIRAAYETIVPRKKDPLIQASEVRAKVLQKLFKANVEVTRSKTPDRFHVMFRDQTEVQVRELCDGAASQPSNS